MAEGTADVLVVFGITGDLAKVMTFRSLYRLEKRGLLDCPIVGVAVDDWTVDQLRQRARESIEGTGEQLDPQVFDRLAARLSYVQGDFGDAATYERVGAAIKGAKLPVFYLEIPPFLFGTVVKGLKTAGLTDNARVVVEKPFGHDQRLRARARRRAAPVDRRVAALPDRPLPGEDGRRGDPPPAVRELDARAGLEPQLPLERADHDGGGLRRRGPRPLLRPGRRAARRRRQPSDAGRRDGCDGGAVPRRPDDDQGLPGRALPRGQGGRPGALRARAVRRLHVDRRRGRGLDDRDVRSASARHRELALGRRAVLHPHGQAPAGDPDRAAARLPPTAAPRLRLRPGPRAEPARRQARPDDRDPAARRSAAGGQGAAPGRSSSTRSSRCRAARARRRTRCCCTRR